MIPYYKMATIQYGIQDNWGSWNLSVVERILAKMLREGGVSQFIVWSEHPFEGNRDLYWHPGDIGGWNGGGP